RRGKAPKLYFAQMSKAFLQRDPFSCVLCGARMVYTAAIAGLTVQGLINNAQSIAQLRYEPPRVSRRPFCLSHATWADSVSC
ncbi:hypothetical protein NLO93_28185, partial [Pseudomonas savastanoi]|nr:hypothetical protein [Pseudomonas savastanoi]